MENRSVATNELLGCGDVVEEAGINEVTGSCSHDTTSVVNPKEQEQTNSDLKNVTSGIETDKPVLKLEGEMENLEEKDSIIPEGEDQNNYSEQTDSSCSHDAISFNPNEGEQACINSDLKNATRSRTETDKPVPKEDNEIENLEKKDSEVEDQNNHSEKADSSQQTKGFCCVEKPAQIYCDSQNVTDDKHGAAEPSDLLLKEKPVDEAALAPADDDDVGRAQPGDQRSSCIPPLSYQPADARPEVLSRNVIILTVLVSLFSFGVMYFNGSSTRPDPKKDSSVDIFRREFDKMKSSFPSQRTELWKRSKIHLERHLLTAEPTEPVSMILTAGRGAEGTLRCLASRMAAAFSSAHGASVIHVDGASMAALESDQVKLDIDERLKVAFEGDQKAAVIHRFEELPPGSTLIFYRYCDHENAAYKGSFLIFTVLLEEDELKSHLNLSTIEEIVQEHIKDKFLSSGYPASFDKMDVDKLSGLWSRISHLILPVAVVESFEKLGCKMDT